MAYETKTIAELEELARNLRRQLTLHPQFELEKIELEECERWLETRRQERESQPPGAVA